jgi:hypothetical protein
MTADFPLNVDEQLFAACTCEQAEQLVGYDHHRVWVEGRAGILLTYHWMPLEEATEPLLLKVVFHKSASQHPAAPPDIQRLINQVQFRHNSNEINRS